jgi:aminopeptidase I
VLFQGNILAAWYVPATVSKPLEGLVSSDLTHAFNPNFPDAYLENDSPRLNVGVAVVADPNGHTMTDCVSTALLQRVAQECGR